MASPRPAIDPGILQPIDPQADPQRPRQQEPAAAAVDDPLRRLPMRDGLPTFRVAVIDDDENDYAALARMLRGARRARFELTHVPSLDAATTLLPTGRFDVALIDFCLGEAHGIDLVRELGGWRGQIPMLLLTGADDEQVAFSALQAGVADFIDKNEMTAVQVERAIIYAYVRHDVEAELLRSQQLLRQARDEARQANAAKSDFLARMSHELRTPLNAINGYAELMVAEVVGTLHSKYREYADNILTSGHLLLELINDLMDLTRIESGRHTFAFEAVNVEDEVRALLETFFAQASTVPITLTAEVEAGLPTILADRRAFKQVAINLLSNALKFTPAGGAVTVHAYSAGSRVIFAVSDSGIGIEPEQIDGLFTPFVQADIPFVRHTNGAGLGLAIVKSLVKHHGGQVTMESAPGQGTDVVTDWPVADPRRAPRPMPGRSTAKPASSSAPKADEAPTKRPDARLPRQVSAR